MPKWQELPDGDVVCEHGTAIDVHCCNCHGGFLMNAEDCECEFTPKARKMDNFLRNLMFGVSIGFVAAMFLNHGFLVGAFCAIVAIGIWRVGAFMLGAPRVRD